jgi:tRNA(Ile2)-agmatinylcytidine synthase
VRAIWIGIDDTDSPSGGCTTYTLTEVLREATRLGFDLVGWPRLVRLNPNIPWKTRGNAALAAHFGHGRGSRHVAGSIDGRVVWSYERAAPLEDDERAELTAAAWAATWSHSRIGEPGTDPALVASPRRLPSELYYRAVRTVVAPADTLATLRHAGARFHSSGSRRGVVGAAAAVAWPGRRRTFELIAYRYRERWGRPREVDAAGVRRAARRHPSLFLCYDRRTRRVLVAPHTACPILYGLRSTDPASARAAHSELRHPEPWERWLIYATNQGSGDHLVARTLAELGPYESGILTGTVVDDPRTEAGGHVHFEIQDDQGGRRPLVAFEPTKTLPKVAQWLRAGDRLRAWGSRGEGETVRLEGLQLLRLRPTALSTAPPACPRCGRQMHSAGRGRGFRCKRCRTRLPPEAATRRTLRPPLPREPVFPTASARRHLAPLTPEL